MSYVSKESSTQSPPLVRRFPLPFEGVDLNLCRNPLCASHGIIPDPFECPNGAPPAAPDALRSVVKGRMREAFFECPTCDKINRAVFKECNRLKHLQENDPTKPSCRTKGWLVNGMTVDEHPEFYRRHGKTPQGDPRWQCRLCSTTISHGKPSRRHMRSDRNRIIFQMLCNDMSLSKIGKITDTSCRDSAARSIFSAIRSKALWPRGRTSPRRISARLVPGSRLIARLC